MVNDKWSITIHSPFTIYHSSFFRDCFRGALSGACAAIDALLGVDDALVAIFRDRLDRAGIHAFAASFTFFLHNNISHDETSFFGVAERVLYYFSTIKSGLGGGHGIQFLLEWFQPRHRLNRKVRKVNAKYATTTP